MRAGQGQLDDPEQNFIYVRSAHPHISYTSGLYVGE